MSSWFGDLNLGAKYALGLGALMTVVITFAFIQLLRHRRKVKKHAAALQAKSADEESRMEQIGLTQHQESEGDLFGIRALERGFTGGVPQSRPVSPALTSVSTTTLHIPYGRNPSKSTLVTSIALDLGAGSSKSSSSGKGKAPSTTVDMSMAVPDSPRNNGHNHARSLSSGPYRFMPGASCSSLTLDRVPWNQNGEGSGSGESLAGTPRRSSPTDTQSIGQAITTAGYSPESSIVVLHHSQQPSQSQQFLPDHRDVSSVGESINRTSTAPPEPRGRNRIKQASTASFGELYDSYYEPRESMPSLPGSANDGSEDEGRNNRYSRTPSRALM